jgi:hypothetical protein
MVPTLPTPKHALTPAVVASDVPTAATLLRGMSWINHDHRTTSFFGLVLDFRLEARKRPRVHPSLGLSAPFGLHPLPKVFEVFQHDRRAWPGGRHDLLAEDMIGIFPKSRPTLFQLSQMPFGRLCAPLLQGADVLEVATFDRFPASLAQEAVVRRDRRTVDTQVDANNRISRFNLRRLNREGDVQPPCAVSCHQVGRINRTATILCRVIRHVEGMVCRPVVVLICTVRLSQSTR